MRVQSASEQYELQEVLSIFHICLVIRIIHILFLKIFQKVYLYV
jgi:hypothetical protein